MSTKHLLDPELHPLLDILPDMPMSADRLPGSRKMFLDMVNMGDPDENGVTREEVTIPGPEGAPDIRCLIYKPKDAKGKRPAFLHIHGGGYVVGLPEMSDEMNLRVCGQLGTVVLSVDYRLAPEHPIPAPLDDCYAGLAWLHKSAEELGIDRERIAIGGESAGGGLAAALGLKARDLAAYAVCHQQLVYPMLDDRTGTSDAPGDPLCGEFVWTRDSNQFGWTAYLGDAPRAAPQVPARADSLKGLPPTWILTAALDLFRDENIAYAQRLMADGVKSELHIYPAACHGFQMIPGTTLNKRYVADYMGALKRGLGVD